MLEGKQLHLPQHTAPIMSLTYSGPAITKDWNLRYCGSSSSSVTSLHTPYGAPKPAQEHHSMKRSATAGGKIIREARNLKKEPGRPIHSPPPLFKKAANLYVIRDHKRPVKVTWGWRILLYYLLFSIQCQSWSAASCHVNSLNSIGLHSVIILKASFINLRDKDLPCPSTCIPL